MSGRSAGDYQDDYTDPELRERPHRRDELDGD